MIPMSYFLNKAILLLQLCIFSVIVMVILEDS